MRFQIYCLFVLGLSGLVLGSKGENLSDIDDEGVHLNARLFATTGEPISPTKSLEYLKRLDKIYSILNVKIFENLRQEVRTLLELSDVRRVHCTYFGLSDYNTLIEANGRDKQLNIVAYLEHFRKEALLFCKSRWAMLLSDELKDLDAEEAQNIGSLRESVLEANGHFNTEYPFYSRESLIGGILSFMQQSGSLDSQLIKDSKNGQTLFADRFEVDVENLCYTIRKKLHYSFEIYYHMMDKKELIELLEPEAVKFLISASICRDVVYPGREVCREAYMDLTGKEFKQRYNIFGNLIPT